MQRFIQHSKPDFGEEEATACYKYMLSGGYVTEYKLTQQLEQIIADFVGSKHCIMVNNGTISLVLALLAVGVQAGDEVIVPNLTMVASLNAIKLINAIPRIIDVEEETLTIDTQLIYNLLTPRTKAIMHVSLNGKCNNIEQLQALCRQNSLYLIEDSAQSLGSFYKGRHLGTFGDIGSFSLSTPKIISTGQGGALITDNDDLATTLRRLKDFGRAGAGTHEFLEFGINAKFTDLQAVIGIEQMKKLSARIKRKREIWRLYYSQLKDLHKIKILPSNDNNWTPWVIDIYTQDRDELRLFLKQNNIDTRLQYPVLADNSAYPTSLHYSEHGLWLPATFDLKDSEILQICEIIKMYYNNK